MQKNKMHLYAHMYKSFDTDGVTEVQRLKHNSCA